MEIGGEQVGVDRRVVRRRRHDQEPFHEVAQLAHVARPVEGLQYDHRVLTDRTRQEPGALRRPFHEEADERGDVFPALAQRGNPDRHNTKTIEEVFAEIA